MGEAAPASSVGEAEVPGWRLWEKPAALLSCAVLSVPHLSLFSPLNGNRRAKQAPPVGPPPLGPLERACRVPVLSRVAPKLLGQGVTRVHGALAAHGLESY